MEAGRKTWWIIVDSGKDIPLRNGWGDIFVFHNEREAKKFCDKEYLGAEWKVVETTF